VQINCDIAECVWPRSRRPVPAPPAPTCARQRAVAVMHRLRLSRPSQEGEALSTSFALRAAWSPGRSCAARPRPCGARWLSLACLAPLLTVCRSSILAETPGSVASFACLLRGKRRVFERHKRLLTDQLPSSTHTDTLSGRQCYPDHTSRGQAYDQTSKACSLHACTLQPFEERSLASSWGAST
jgi:hypothetical protein